MRALNLAAAFAVGLAGACAEVDTDVVMPVRLAIDYESCGVDRADLVEFSCGGALSVWVVDGESGAAERDECMRMDPGAMSLALVPELLSENATFDHLDSDAFFLGLGVWTPSRGDYCRSWSDMEADRSGALPLVFGLSETVTARDGAREIRLPLRCQLADTTDPMPPDSGYGYDECVEDCKGGIEPCDLPDEMCCPGEDGSNCCTGDSCCGGEGCPETEACLQQCEETYPPGTDGTEDPQIDPYC